MSWLRRLITRQPSAAASELARHGAEQRRLKQREQFKETTDRLRASLFKAGRTDMAPFNWRD